MTITFDLRTAWLTTFAPAANTAGTEDGEQGDEDTQGGAADGTASPPATDTTQPPTEEELRNPRIKALSDEAAKHRTNAKAEKDRADAAEARYRQLSLKVAFNDALRKQGITDSKAAWKLAQDELSDVEVDDDGNADDAAVAAVIKKLATEYPSLVTVQEPQSDRDALEEKFPALAESGRPLNARRNSGGDGNLSTLEKKFPALRRNR